MNSYWPIVALSTITALMVHTHALPGLEGETVILVHGMMNHPVFMKRIEWSLKKAGYEVVNWGYPSRDRTIEQHAESLDQFVETINARKIHFVGFSLGSLIVRCYLTRYSPEKVGRFVMIAPPNHGAGRVDALYPYRWFRSLYGNQSMPQLLSSNQKFYEELGIPPVEFGIIAGGKGNERGYSKVIPGDDDGTVSVESTKLGGTKDFIQLNPQHTVLLFSQDTSNNVVSFIQSGRFNHH